MTTPAVINFPIPPMDYSIMENKDIGQMPELAKEALTVISYVQIKLSPAIRDNGTEYSVVNFEKFLNKVSSNITLFSEWVSNNEDLSHDPNHEDYIEAAKFLRENLFLSQDLRTYYEEITANPGYFNTDKDVYARIGYFIFLQNHIKDIITNHLIHGDAIL